MDPKFIAPRLFVNLLLGLLALTAACATEPPQGDIYLRQAYIARDSGDIDEAREKAELAIDDGRREREARELLAALSRTEAREKEADGDHAGAMEAYLQAAEYELKRVRRARDLQSALQAATRAAVPMGDLLELTLLALEDSPDNIELHREAARLAEELDDPQTAHDHYLWLVSADPENMRATFRLGIAFLSLDRPADAAAVLLRVYRADPTHLQAAMNLISAYDDLGRHEDTRELFEELVREFPDQPFILNRFAAFEEEQGNSFRADRLRQRAEDAAHTVEQREMRPLR